MRNLSLLVFVAIAVLPAASQSAAPPTALSSQQRAFQVLQKAVAAHGGIDKLERARTADVRISVETFGIYQSPLPDPPFRTYIVRGRYIADPAHNRMLFESDMRFPSFRNHTRTVVIDGKGELIDLLAGTIVMEENLAGGTSLLNRVLPDRVLLDALSRRATLRFLGRSAGHTHELVSFARANGDFYTLYFDAQTGLLSQMESLQPNAIEGDAVFIHHYLDYQQKPDGIFPLKFQLRRGKHIAANGVIDELASGTPPPDADFTIPSGLRRIASYDPPMQFQTVAPGVHVLNFVPGGYNVLCVEFADHLAVMETPDGSNRSDSREIIRLLKERFPGKPIRYAIATHHHADHVAGVRAYMAEGATIISVAEDQSFLRELAVAHSTIAPDSLSANPRPPQLKLVGPQGLVLKDAAQELNLIRVIRAPHIDNMLAGYLPRHKLLYQTDLFNPWSCFRAQVPNEDIGHTTALGDTQALIAAVARNELGVDRVYGGHGRPVSYDWLRQYTLRREQDGKPMWACTAEEMLDE